MEQKVFLIRDLSNESKEAEKVLIDNGIYPVQVMSFSTDTSPALITNDNSYTITGLDEIKEYAEKHKIQGSIKSNE